MRTEQPESGLTQWQALAGGDEDALVWLFDTFSQRLFNYGMKVVRDREMVKDCIQDLFSDLWKNRLRLLIPESPRVYLFSALKYKLIRKAARLRTSAGLAGAGDELDVELSIESVMIAQQTATENRLAVENALRKLTSRQREVLLLRYYEEMTPAEIADLLKINKQSVYNLLYSALANLKQAILLELNILSLLVAGCIGIGMVF